jgi:hypothetical protein
MTGAIADASEGSVDLWQMPTTENEDPTAFRVTLHADSE